jgi:hypothetical protein
MIDEVEAGDERMGRASGCNVEAEGQVGTLSQQEVEESLSAIMGVLAANPNCSQDELFQCCANAFEIAETTLAKLQNGK